jgi:hypothetical protein
MDPREKQVRDAHPDWTDEQVNAEVARLKAADPPPAPQPDPPKPDDAAFARLRREKEEADRRAKAAEDALAGRERKEAEEQGRWKELAEQEKARADRLEQEGKDRDARANAERAARDLKFQDPGYVLYLLQQDRIDLADAAAVKTALETLAQNRTDLLASTAPPLPSGGPAGGGGPGGGPKLTAEQLAAMPPDQIAKLDPKIVNEALAG